MKKFLLILCLLCMPVFANDYTRIEEINPIGQYIITPEFYIEVWEYDTDKSSCWMPSDRLIVTARGYLINIDRNETVRMVNIKLR